VATNFPSSLDSLSNPSSGDSLSSPSHSGQHADANDAIEALEAKVGVDGSAVTTSLDYKVAASKAVTDKVDPSGATSNQVLKYNGTKFVPSTGASVTISDTPPSSPQAGDQWYESDTGRQFIYYDSVWVEIGNATDIAGVIQPKQITDLTAVTSLTSDDVFAVVDNPSSAVAANKITYGNLVTAMSSSLAPGLVLVKTQTVGTGVSVIEVTDAFSSTYDNYRLTYSGGTGSTWITFNCQFGVGTTWTTNNYYGGSAYFNVGGGTWQLAVNNGGSSFAGGNAMTDFCNVSLEIQNPYLARRTHAQGPYNRLDNGQVGNTWVEQASQTQFTSFKLATSSGTVTGGTIRVYGYRN